MDLTKHYPLAGSDQSEKIISYFIMYVAYIIVLLIESCSVVFFS